MAMIDTLERRQRRTDEQPNAGNLMSNELRRDKHVTGPHTAKGVACKKPTPNLKWAIFASLVMLSRPSFAFQSFHLKPIRGNVDTGIKRRSCSHKTHPISSIQLDMVNEDTQGSENLHADPDRVRRRNLLLSMLVASNGITFGKNALADSEEEVTKAPLTSEEILNVLKPPLDDRDYVSYVLDNGLRVLLCSDPLSTEAAAAMDVHVGACSDPVEVPGLAHFNEHMLFLGTKPYPQEDSFEKFLSANGGKSNAYTSSEDTVYFFDVEAENGNKLSEALLRFGSFFSSPLFTPSATGRELNAIESENAKNLQSDAFRVYQLMKSRASSNHPYSKFFTGNKKTLLDDTKKQGIDLREQLVQFYNKYYSANQMTLAVVAPQSIQELKAMVAESFSSIPNRGAGKPELSWAGTPPFDGNSKIPSLQHIVEAVPVQDLRQVTLTWPIVYQSEQDRVDSLLVKPANYVAHLLGHEGPGSLLSYLKRQGWANSLAASSESELSDFETFEATVGLTTKGLAAVDKVVESIFSYISMLRGKDIPSYVFDEVLQLDELNWRFLSKGNVGNYVQSLASSMQKYDPTLYVAGPRRIALAEPGGSLITSSDPRSSFSSNAQFKETEEKVYDFVSKLSVSNTLITILSNTFKGQTDKREIWYGTEYRVKPVPQATLLQWQNCASPKSLKVKFPRPNPFIPTESGLVVKKPPPKADLFVKQDFESRTKPIPPPQLIRDDERWTTYFKQDDRFGRPKAFVVFQLLTPKAYSSAAKAVLAEFYSLCISDRLGEYAYDAQLADMTYDVKVLPRGIRLTFGGYDEKLLKFVTYISKKISANVKDILPKNESEFERYRDLVKRGLSGFDVKQPYSHASYYSSLTIMPMRFEYVNSELRNAAAEVTLQDLKSFANELWSSGKGQALIQGNLEEKEAAFFVDTVDKALRFQAIPSSEVPAQLEPLPLPIVPSNAIPTRLVISEPNEVNGNSASHVVLQSLGSSGKDHVLIELVSAILAEPFYEELRTKRQLGYIVSSGVRALGNSRMLAFIVQSSTVPVETSTTEILKYLDGVRDKLNDLPKAEFGVYVKGLIDRKTEPDKKLAEEVMRNWLEISSGRLEFNRTQMEIAALLELEKTDLIEFWEKIYVGVERRVLITEVVPQVGQASSPRPPTTFGSTKSDTKTAGGLVYGIDDIEQFRRDRDTTV